MNKILILFLLSTIGFVYTSCKTYPNKKLEVGDTVPNFSLKDQNNQVFESKNYIGKQPLVVYFYPKDDTPSCTKEACKFRDNFEAFSDLNVKVIGISSDDIDSHAKFAKKYNLPFTLLADTNKKVRKLFRVPAFGAGILPGRVTYIIDKKGIVQYIFNDMKQAELHIDKALETIKKFD